MRILVTGGTGFIGSRVVHMLSAYPGVDITLLVRSGSHRRRLRARGVDLEGSQVHHVIADLRSRDEIATAVRRVRPKVIVHLAMVYHPPGAPAGGADESVNLHGTLCLLDAFLETGGRRFIAAGSCFEYGHNDCERIDETHPCRPVYDYAVAKLMAAEAILTKSRAASIEALVLRVFAPYGPREAHHRIVPQLLTAGRSSARLSLSPGEQVRDYVFVDDVARAFLAAVQAPLPRPQAVYNVGTGTGHSLRKLAATVEQVLGRRLSLGWGELPYRPDEMMRLVANHRRIADDLGWRPTHTLEEGLRRTVAGEAAAPARVLPRESA